MFDRFEQGFPDIQDMPVLGHCKVCGDSMYWHRDNIRICDYCEDEDELEDERSESEVY